jgi:hypothetical protein
MLTRRNFKSRIVGWSGNQPAEMSIEVSVGKTKISLETFADVRKFIANNTPDGDTK